MIYIEPDLELWRKIMLLRLFTATILNVCSAEPWGSYVRAVKPYEIGVLCHLEIIVRNIRTNVDYSQ